MSTSPQAQPHESAVVKSANRVLQILEAMSGTTNAWQFGELARELAIPKSSLHGLLDTLRQRRWVDLDEATGRYSLGIRSIQVASSYLSSLSVLQMAGRTLDRLNEVTGETVQFGRIDGGEVVYLAKRQARHPVQLISDIGTRLPANCTALGKAILSTYSNTEVRLRLSEPLPALTPKSLCTLEALMADLDDARKRGVAVDNEEAIEGIACFAVAIPSGMGPSVEAISVSIPRFRLAGVAAEERIIDLLIAARAEFEV